MGVIAGSLACLGSPGPKSANLFLLYSLSLGPPLGVGVPGSARLETIVVTPLISFVASLSLRFSTAKMEG